MLNARSILKGTMSLAFYCSFHHLALKLEKLTVTLDLVFGFYAYSNPNKAKAVFLSRFIQYPHVYSIRNKAQVFFRYFKSEKPD